MNRRAMLAVLAVALVACSGCAGFLEAPADSAGNATRSTTGSGPGTGTGALADVATNGSGGGDTPGGGDAGDGTGAVTVPDADNPWPALYRETITSVVEVQVDLATGSSQGSGFVYDDAGHVVTNQHVVEGAESVQVRFADGTWRRATVVGTDAYSDLAVLDVDDLPAGVEPLPLGDGDVVTGQRVAALGSPFGYQGTITTGIVSGVNRSMPTEGGFAIPDTVQTDAAINPGNSGGPLVSLAGEVVGVNRAKQGDNLGFAISSDVVRRVVPALVADGEYEHAYLGLQTVPVTPDVAAANGLDRPRGVLVVATRPGGPADGVLQGSTLQSTQYGQVPVGGDVVVAVEGDAVHTGQDIGRYLALHASPGETLTLTVLRDGERVTVEVTAGTRPAL